MPTKKRRAPGDGGLHKRKDNGLWVGSVEIPSADGTRHRKYVAAKQYAEAKRKLDELRDELREGLVPVSNTTTLAVWLRYWVDHIKKPHVRKNTYDWYEEAVRLHITPHIGRKKLKALTPADVRWMLEQIETSGNRQRAHKTLKMALADAMTKERLIRYNAAESVDKPGHIQRARDALGADAAIRALRAAIQVQETSRDETGPLLAVRFITGMLTGARPAEVLGLEWDRVNLADGVIDFSWQLQQVDKEHGCGEPQTKSGAFGTIQVYPCGKKRASFCPAARWPFNDGDVYRECVGSLVWTLPKTSAGTRVVPISAMPVLTAMLRQHQADTAGQPNPHNLVWHRADGYPITRHDDAKAWRQVLQAAGLPQVEVYAGRHTAATLLQKLGVPEEVRMQIMGQSSAAAHAAYVHVDQTQTRAALGKLEQLLLT